ncbi:LacI family DNA-binding transcriptional regulator [Marinovum sp.]|uniref:LacI family DNA-binding transcriptional regulator n=1 Tax=Marinovum sp. TaxID=2024839 RepID=UPI002B26A4B5|nr:substrate-binding domain-containing protein [Marinovum sp.]
MNLKQLSEQLGLSQTTVSRALNGYPEVSEKTRERVRQAALAFNYKPNTRARSLATGRAMAIGHVIPVSTQQEMVNPIFGDFVTGAGEIYSQHGYDMMLSLVPDRDEESFYRDLKIKGNVDGIVVHSPSMDDPRIALLNELGLPYVVHGRASSVTLPYSWVDVANASAFEEMTGHLAGLGHRRIALINGIETLDFAHRRRRGFLHALRDAGLEADDDLMVSSDMTESFGFNETRRMLALPNPPTAFAVASLITALGVRRAIEQAGLTVGRDVSVATFDDDLSYLRNGTEDAPVFSGVRSSVREAGRRVGAILLSRISNPTALPASEMIPFRLVTGTTSGPAPS